MGPRAFAAVNSDGNFKYHSAITGAQISRPDIGNLFNSLFLRGPLFNRWFILLFLRVAARAAPLRPESPLRGPSPFLMCPARLLIVRHARAFLRTFLNQTFGHALNADAKLCEFNRQSTNETRPKKETKTHNGVYFTAKVSWILNPRRKFTRRSYAFEFRYLHQSALLTMTRHLITKYLLGNFT